MGIFSESRNKDVEAISQFVQSSLAYYAAEGGAVPGIQVDSSFDFGFISDVGTRILKEFDSPTALQRVATLVVLCNSCPPFSVTQRGELLLNLRTRKQFLSRFTCLLVQAALSTMTLEREGGTYSLRWAGFPDASFRDQFLVYLQWVESLTVVPGGEPNSREFKQAMEAFEKLLAHLVLGCALVLTVCVTEDTLVPEEPAGLLT